jgi:hypothetical protein
MLGLAQQLETNWTGFTEIDVTDPETEFDDAKEDMENPDYLQAYEYGYEEEPDFALDSSEIGDAYEYNGKGRSLRRSFSSGGRRSSYRRTTTTTTTTSSKKYY